MNRFVIVFASTVAFLSPAAMAASHTDTVLLAESESGQPLTLTSAKHRVAGWLNDSGNRQLRAGRAEFDRDGNVVVEVANATGITVQHVVVNATSGLVAAVPSARKARHAVE